MIAVNDLSTLDAPLGTDALQPLAVLLSPYAPHLAEELWLLARGEGSVLDAPWPVADTRYLVEDQITYPVSFNGKVRFKLELAASLSPGERGALDQPVRTDRDERHVVDVGRNDDRTDAQLGGKPIRKVIVVPGRIVNVVA